MMNIAQASIVLEPTQPGSPNSSPEERPMSIPFTCLHCGQKMAANDSQAGEQAKCPGCGKATTVQSFSDTTE